jgi:hypothetical protein
MVVIWHGDKAEAGNFIKVEGGIVSINNVYDAGESGELVFSYKCPDLSLIQSYKLM